jgi:hypothetical protein
MKALALKEKARDSLSSISSFPECSQRLRSWTYKVDGEIDADTFATEEVVSDLSEILATVKVWIKDGRHTVLVWDEGCPHEGWLEPSLPENLSELDNACEPLRQFLSAVKEALNIIVVEKVANDIRLL